MKTTHQGSCLCGEIRYKINGPITGILNCHCSDCRKSHGAAFRTRGAVHPDDFVFLKGEHLLTRYAHKPDEFRCFCSWCGSNVVTMYTDPTTPLGLALGTLDTELTSGPKCHVFTSDKASWHTITDTLPQYTHLPPSGSEIILSKELSKPSKKEK